jgi:mRNA (guanine-N7-)-methyltransferase
LEKLIEHDCTNKFHVASSQFSIHYSFESYEQAVRFISNAANNLIKHGVFIGTYPDGPKLLKLARQSKTPGLYEVDDILRVEFSPEDLKHPKPFGTKYHFKLKEVVDCPEFLVHPEILRSLMKATKNNI